MSVPTVAEAREPRRFSPRQFAVHHPVTAYFLIAFAGSWLLMLPGVLSLDGLALLNFRVPESLQAPLFILTTFLGPTLGAYVVTNVLEGKAGMLRLLRRYVQWRVGAVPWLLSVFGYPLIVIGAGIIVLGAAPLQGLAANPLTFFTVYLPALLIFPALLTWGEEPGWKGFALTRMQLGHNPLVAALVVGFVHALWHLPMYVMTAGPNAAGPFNLTTFVTNTFMIMAMTILWTWVFNRAMGSILIAVLLHASTNATGPWINAFAPELFQNQNVMLLATAVIAVLTVLAIALTRGKLGYAGQRAE